MNRKFSDINLRKPLPYRARIIIIAVGFGLGMFSLFYTWQMARELREKENYEVKLWRIAMQSGIDSPLMDTIKSSGNNIPFIITNENYMVQNSNRIPEKTLSNPDLLQKRLEQLARENVPLEVVTRDRYNPSRFHRLFIFYGNSQLQKTLSWLPFFQLVIIAVFIAFAFITYRTSEHDEQNKVWIGLAKETAHQLGTPISSLLGWVEYLRGLDIDQGMVDEMQKDLTRLMKVADRFSKIGSETILSPANVNEVVGSSVMYFRTRIPRNVTLEYNGLAIAPLRAMINVALFEWVVENLLKNALDALQGQGAISVMISDKGDWINIDFRDTGKGINKNNFKRIFEPGFTTKTRGWGLGLSLSRRIIEEYHDGKIFVVDSEIGKGTTIRIMLKRLFD